MKMMSPCFFCDNKAEYTSLNVEKVNGVLDVVEVCKDHFEFPGAS